MVALFSLRVGLEIGREPGPFAIAHHSVSLFAPLEWTRFAAGFEWPLHPPPG